MGHREPPSVRLRPRSDTGTGATPELEQPQDSLVVIRGFFFSRGGRRNHDDLRARGRDPGSGAEGSPGQFADQVRGFVDEGHFVRAQVRVRCAAALGLREVGGGDASLVGEVREQGLEQSAGARCRRR